MFRHNGVLCLWGLAMVTPLFYYRNRWRAFVFATALSLLVFYGYSSALHSSFGIKRLANMKILLATVKLAILADQDVPLGQTDYELLNNVRKIDPDRWDYHPEAGGTTTTGVDVQFAEDHQSEYAELFIRLAKRYPLLYLQDHLDRSHVIFAAPYYRGAGSLVGRMENPKSVTDKGYKNNLMFPVLGKKVSEAVSVLPNGACLLYWPSLHLYLVLLGLLILIVRIRDWRYLIVFFPVLINTISITIAPVMEDVRYHFPLTLTSGFLICLAFIPKPPKNTVDYL